MLSCFNVADYFIWLANETGSFISNLKLQKLVYYAQAWHLALNDTPLFPEDFQAWIHGPVIPALYQKYRLFGWQPILEDVNPELPQEVQEFLDEVAQEYFACDGYELEQMTHAETPWNLGRGNLPLDEASNEVIQKQWMKEYYGSRVDEKNITDDQFGKTNSAAW
ncbi:Panacea domain-containing protein [Nostoc sp.]|uniref:Panacea domain-containing protein n=1 Tax=Nostoc sp. TaxID=1180 RepID=UPI002FF42CC5